MSSPHPLSDGSLNAVTIAIPQYVVHRSFVAETVLLNIDTGQYHGLDPVGGRFLDVLLATPSAAHAAEALATEFGQPVERVQEDLVRFCDGLRERGLIEIRALER
jgi:hypothetical protein